MKRQIKIPALLLILALNLMILTNTTQPENFQDIYSPDSTLSIKADSPINIQNNTALAALASLGNGSASNPYILENYVINASGLGLNGIIINNTDAYFILRNCTVTNAAPTLRGIWFENVTHATITNNTILYNQWGILLWESSYNTLSHNNASYNLGNGMQVRQNSDYNKIFNNTLNHNAVGLELHTSSNHNMVINNTGNYNVRGLEARFSCINNTFAYNTANHNSWDGFYFRQCTDHQLIHNIAKNNTLNGYFLELACDNNNISFNLIEDNGVGVRLSNSDSNTIMKNHLFGNTQLFQESGSTGNLFINNVIMNILTPENKTYSAPMSGFYPGTEGFEDAADGTLPPRWSYSGSGSGYYAEVIASKADGNSVEHKKVLYGHDAAAGRILNITGQFSENRTSGTYEFWILYEDLLATNYEMRFGLRNASDSRIIWMCEEDESFKYWNGSMKLDTGISFAENKWFRVSVDFSDDGTYAGLAAHQYKFRIYDSDGTTLLYMSPNTNYYFGNVGAANHFRINTGNSSQAQVYIDALGLSWNPEYAIGDNVDEGLLLNFTSEIVLDEMGYSLDGGNLTPIWGNSTLNLPQNGLYSIQLYGNDSLGRSYISDRRNFSIAAPPKAPVLYPILPNIDNDGIIALNWSNIIDALTYYIYRHNSTITTTDGLIPITNVSTSNYLDNVTTNGTYYYVIVAENVFGNSSISNCENVTIAILLYYFDWKPQITRAVGNFPSKVFIGDVNNDGQKDIVSINDGDDTISILCWNSTIEDWNPQLTKPVGSSPTSILFVGDVNNDGENDIIAHNNLTSLSIFLWNSTIKDWNSVLIKSIGNGVQDVCIGDANNDGQNDIVTADGANTISIRSWNLTIQDWNPQLTKPVGNNPTDVVIGDMNNDGENDIVTSNNGSSTISIYLWNTTIWNWTSQLTKPVGNGPGSVFIGDVNNDGENDIVTANIDDDTVSIYLWNQTTWVWNSELTRAVGIGPSGVFVGDANNDGQKDIVTSNNGSNTVSILCWNPTDGTWANLTTRFVGLSPQDVFIGDANNDGENDIVTANGAADNVSILLWNTPAGGWDPPIIKVFPGFASYPEDVAIGDANNDGQNDIVLNHGEDSKILLWNTTSGTWDSEISRQVGNDPDEVYVADVNNDGQNDIVAARINDALISILLWNITTRDWDAYITRSVGALPQDVFVGDANNDGQNDIVICNIGADTVSILLWNISSQDWNPRITRNVGELPTKLSIGDANNDGQNDIVTADNFADTISILLWNITSNDWDPPITKSVGVEPQGISIKDANNDGQKDIVIANFVSDDISIFLWNTSSRDWNNQIRISVGNGPYDIFIGDANNDGQNDILIPNFLGNTLSLLVWNITLNNWNSELQWYSGNRPVTGIIGDANNDGYNDIVMDNVFGKTVAIFLWNHIPFDTPVLDPITPSIDTDGIILLNWTDVLRATTYYVYRDTSPILSVDTLTPITLVSESNFTDTITINGLYYYVIVAGNGGGNTSISNCENVTVAIPVTTPVLDPILPNPSPDGLITLNWSDVVAVITYYIYRDTSNISSISGLTPIATVVESNYTDILSINGYYFYVIVAGNTLGNSSISNCENVTVAIPTSPPLHYPIMPNPDIDGVITLNWSDVVGATNYYIYRNTTEINSTTGLTPITMITVSNYTDIITTNRPYFYVIVADNGWANSSISNCENVTVTIPLNAPLLDPILPNPDPDGIITLNWGDVAEATTYYIYRNTSEITSLTGLTPIATVNDSDYTDAIVINGFYYYVIVAGDNWANGSISNCENVTVTIPSSPPILDPILPAIDVDGIINLNWSDVADAVFYYIYRNISYITSLNGLSPIATVTESNYTDFLTTNGLYYYTIIIDNGWANSSLSNCENVTVAIPHNAPVLEPISPAIVRNGTVMLNWSDVVTATIYYIYRNTSTITSVAGLSPIATIGASDYTDIVLTNGLYYYAIVAGDGWANGSISNCENVTIGIPPTPPLLDTIFPSLDSDGMVNLIWNDLPTATIYYIYRDTSNITSVDGLIPIATTSTSFYMDFLTSNGIYYYVVVAGNSTGNSLISNCQHVTVAIPSPSDDAPPDYNFLLVAIIIAGVAIAAAILVHGFLGRSSMPRSKPAEKLPSKSKEPVNKNENLVPNNQR
ncbi:MAG: VCBS repeat-containing protein [Candidatus Helarchaeota archaeon]|nr:VCBS repeat-containing protein [Candidatus Helarchaeota archaeon]